MRQTSPLSRPMHCGLVRESLQIAVCPCWEEALPDVISSICVEVLGPVPRRASAVPLPVSSRRTSASPYVQEVRRAETPAMLATSMTNRFRGCSHSVMFTPRLLLPQKRNVFWAAGPCTPRKERVVTHHELWYRYVPESGNWHDGTCTRKIEAFSAATCTHRVWTGMHSNLFVTLPLHDV
jgi:hypothetical protein